MARQNTIRAELRKRQITGLLIILAIILIASIYHAGLAQVTTRPVSDGELFWKGISL